MQINLTSTPWVGIVVGAGRSRWYQLDLPAREEEEPRTLRPGAAPQWERKAESRKPMVGKRQGLD